MQLKSKVAVVVFTVTITAIAVVTVAVVNYFAYSGPVLHRAMVIGIANALVLAVPISAFVAIKMHQNWLLTEKLRHSLHTDRLTGLTSREAFFDLVNDHPTGAGLVMMIDIDRFKLVNDRLGHLAGDHVLQQVAKLLVEECPAPAVLGRFGGDEFVVFVPSVVGDEGRARAEDLRRAVATAKLRTNGEDVFVTVSIGTAIKQEMADFRTALHQADGALYAAKNAGRNQVAQG